MRFVERKTLSDEGRVLDACHIRPQVKLRCSRGWGGQAARALPAYHRVGGSLHKLLIAKASEHRIFVAQTIVKPAVAAVVVDDLVSRGLVIVEAKIRVLG